MRIKRADMNTTVIEIGFRELNHESFIASDMVKLYKRNRFYIGSNFIITFKGTEVYKFKIRLDEQYYESPEVFNVKGVVTFDDGKVMEFKVRESRTECEFRHSYK